MPELNGPSALSIIHSKYPFRYFTSAQCKLYFESILIDEAVAVQYVAQQPFSPLFAYDDCGYTRTTRNKNFAQGQILINFIEEGYLYYALKELRERKGAVVNTVKTIESETTETNGTITKHSETSTTQEVTDVTNTVNRSKNPINAVKQLYRQKGLRDTLAEATKAALGGKELADHRNIVYGLNEGDTHRGVIFDMTLDFGVRGEPVFTSKFFKDVQLISNQMTVDINSPDSIMESYGFICKYVR